MLTKSRVAQLLFMLVVLLLLFFWRTFDMTQAPPLEEEEKSTQQVSLLRCDYLQPCEFITEQGEYLLNIKNLPIKAEQWINFELSTPNDKLQVSKAKIVGKSMFMGRIPVTFKQSSAQLFTAKTLVGACTSAEMIWLLEITVDMDGQQEVISFDFMVKR